MNGTEYLLPQVKKQKIKLFYSEQEIMDEIDATGIEISLMISTSFNMIAFDYFRKFLEYLKAGNTQEGRDRYGYVRDYLKKSKDNSMFRSVFSSAENLVKKYDKSLMCTLDNGSMIVRDDFVSCCADSFDVVDDNLRAIIDAARRFVVIKEVEDPNTPDDIWCYADMFICGFLSSIIREVWTYLFVEGEYKAVNDVKVYNYLNGNALFDQVTKMMKYINIKGMDGNDCPFSPRVILDTKEFAKFKKDIICALFSCENLNQLFQARRNERPFNDDKKSFVKQIENDTMSLDYYKSYYSHAYHLQNLHKKKLFA